MSEKELREIDAQITERVMGWDESERGFDLDGSNFWIHKEHGVMIRDRPGSYLTRVFAPTTNPSDAMAVFIACQNKCALLLFNDGPDHSSISATTKENGFAFYAREDGEPMTVSLCKFALKLFP